MLSLPELKVISSTTGKSGYFVSLYLNVDPLYNKKGDYMVHFKNMIKQKAEETEKAIFKRVSGDFAKMDSFMLTEKRRFKRGLALLSSSENGFWREYHLGVPVRNEIIVESAPYTKPLYDILDNYQRYAVLFVTKESARIFVVQLGEIVEYGEVHTPDVPGRHKKGGWYALSQNHYERHIDYHVSLHVRDVIEKLDSFLGGESISRLILGGSDEALSKLREMLPKGLLERVIGSVRVEKFTKPDEVLLKVQPLVDEFEKQRAAEDVETLVSRSMKNNHAVLGIDNVLNALQEQRVMKLMLLRDYRVQGYSCGTCGLLAAHSSALCPFCKGEMQKELNITDRAVEKAVQQGAVVGVLHDNEGLKKSGGVGAFLRF